MHCIVLFLNSQNEQNLPGKGLSRGNRNRTKQALRMVQFDTGTNYTKGRKCETPSRGDRFRILPVPFSLATQAALLLYNDAMNCD